MARKQSYQDTYETICPECGEIAEGRGVIATGVPLKQTWHTCAWPHLRRHKNGRTSESEGVGGEFCNYNQIYHTPYEGEVLKNLYVECGACGWAQAS